MGELWFRGPTRRCMEEVCALLRPTIVPTCTHSRLHTFSAFDILRYPDPRMADFAKVIPELAAIDPHILSRIDVDGVSYHISAFLLQSEYSLAGRYSAHLRRQEADLQTFMDDETLALDPRINYNVVIGLSSEVRERLFTVRPTSIVGPMLRM
jgi:tRNA uridine 5-carboxymethylaminomethyl modification enzyme